MMEKINISDWNPLEYLNTDEACFVFLADAVESGDKNVIAKAATDVILAKKRMVKNVYIDNLNNLVGAK